MIVGLKILMAGSLALLLCGPGCHRRNESIDRQAIERLHQLDVEATFTNSADELAKLWDNDAVRLQAGGPAEVGKTKICTVHHVVGQVRHRGSSTRGRLGV